MKKIVQLFVVGIFLFTQLVCANEQRGLEIAQKIDRLDTGFVDASAELEMILENRNGDLHTRKLKMKILEVIGDGKGDKSLSIFSSPRDIKGTAFLNFTRTLMPDDQWLYLPALKRVKRISSSNKSGPYLGSEFAFEDLNSFEVSKYKYNYLRDETLNNIECLVMELYPQYDHSGYTRQIIWVDKERYIPIKIDYYDRKNKLLKTQSFINYQQYLGQYWRADEMLMENHSNGKSTRLVWNNYQFGNGYTDRDFDKNTLKRAR